MIPNLFSIATTELSQDAFITWLLLWADPSTSTNDEVLNQIGQKFVYSLLEKAMIENSFTINSVKAGRQWKNMDIWADINDKYFIVIEDKKDSCEHGNQLEKYKKIAEKRFKSEREIILIYLKTGNESINNVEEIFNKGWLYYNRKDFMKIISSLPTNNDILNDYLNYLQGIDNSTDSYVKLENLLKRKASEGFYLWLQNNINDWSHWNYVSNPSGGFLGFWYHFRGCDKNKKREIYLQFENYIGKKINLYIRIGGQWNKTTDYLYKVLGLLKEESKKINLEIEKPPRYSAGEYSSIAIVKDVFKADVNGNLDLDNILKKLKDSEKLIDKVAKLL